MTDQTEAPERIWVEDHNSNWTSDSGLWGVDKENEWDTQYTRADLSDAKDKRIEEREDRLEAAIKDAQEAEAYAAELEAERDHWKDVAGREGVCMTCRGPQGAPDTYGCTDCLNTGYCADISDARIAELEANLAKAVAIANRRGVYVPTAAIECRGDKCRESWCASCCGDDHAEAYVRKATDQDATDRAALAKLKGTH